MRGVIGSCSNGNDSSVFSVSASVEDIQSQRIAGLEAALQAEREANTHIATQLWHLKSENEREIFSRAIQSVPSTPRVVEPPREVARNAEWAELVQQLHQSRAEALHFKNEYDKFVVSYENLGGNLTRASERVEKMMQVRAVWSDF
jgi:2,4-dienoyl-CoA reductase-like NADH-dependent reductase (Old Yellow Enzyme family)